MTIICVLYANIVYSNRCGSGRFSVGISGSDSCFRACQHQQAISGLNGYNEQRYDTELRPVNKMVFINTCIRLV